MKYRLDLIAGVLALGLRLIAIRPASWGRDWIVVLSLFWIALCVVDRSPRARRIAFALAALWLAGIYAWNQGPFTWISPLP